MTIIPKSKSAQVQFCENHIHAWADHAARLGLSEAQIAAFEAATTAARAAYEAARIAMDAAKSAVLEQDLAIAEAVRQARGLIKVIKGTAATSDDAGDVMVAARLPMDAQPTAYTAPGRATDVQFTLLSGGEVEVSWEATNASATSGGGFRVERKLERDAAYQFIGLSHGTTKRKRRMSFTDTRLTPEDARGVIYRLTPVRGAKVGEQGSGLVVQFGSVTSVRDRRRAGLPVTTAARAAA